MRYSVSNAFGRTGAAIGTECFTPLEQAAGKGSTFYLAGSVGVLGMIVYWFCRRVEMSIWRKSM